MGSWCDRLGDFREVQVHRFDIAGGQDQSRALALFLADGTKDIGRCGSLIPRSARASAAFGPPAGDLVLLADTSLVLEPDFYPGCIEVLLTRDCLQARGEVFLKSSITPSTCAWWRGRAESLRYPRARSSRLSVCLAMVMRNSSNIHCARSISRQRTTLWIAGIGPFSIIRVIDWRWASLSLEGCPGALPFSSPVSYTHLTLPTKRIV